MLIQVNENYQVVSLSHCLYVRSHCHFSPLVILFKIFKIKFSLHTGFHDANYLSLFLLTNIDMFSVSWLSSIASTFLGSRTSDGEMVTVKWFIDQEVIGLLACCP